MRAGYIYAAVTMPPPKEIQEALENLYFHIDDNMDLLVDWLGSTNNPFNIYLNAEYELIIGV